ncbi:STAS domain-containing protein [Streptosporangium sp. NBC_01755]|uniref:STAS domain-containing protein n=1 Tax=unclassified Streptosporangium TaxID=2632669 RepID=UPI002DD7F4AF|nr:MULTISPECIES: STAS domain-containing protein [unclassified Streptosporangium]WSA25787.1 STAS domain-containing protein [Streptosporangium sp. NBC_01810]WSD02823.1 STAS domain-containing protein [Streptosporangium sp. NBC_01755]
MSRELSIGVDHHERAGCTVIIVAGDIDRNSSELLRGTIERLVSDYRSRIVIDARDITFCDSTGLRALLSGARMTSEAGGWLRLAEVSDVLKRLLQMTGLYAWFLIDADVAASLAHTTHRDPRLPD